jgi:adenine-specific DNA-methyltransferase
LKPIEVTDPLAQSADLTAENINQLRQLFPEAITEDASGRKVDFGVLRDLLGDAISETEEKYGLNWHGKRAARRLALTPSTGTLLPSADDSVDWDTTQNLMIEGDNLEVLKLLQKSYAGKVKMIYIDPPYNTGKDFVYKDNFTDSMGNYLRQTKQVDSEGTRLTTNPETSGRFHTDWLNMMYPRLILARNLLREDGAIFVSLDEREIHHFRQIASEVFGNEGFVADITVVTNLKGRNDKKHVATCHEHIVIYGRPLFQAYGFPLSDEQKAAFDRTDNRGFKYALRDLRKRGGPDRREDRPKMFFPIYWDIQSDTCSLERHREEDIEILPLKGDGAEGRWRWGRKKVEAFLPWIHGKQSERTGRFDAEHRVYLDPSVTLDSLPLPDEFDEDTDEDEEEGAVERSNKSKSFWIGGEFSTDSGNRVVKELMAPGVFDFPKSLELIKQCVRLGLDSSGIVLDFFAGSGTTGHAVWSLNEADKGNRRFILVQLPQTLDPSRKEQKLASEFCDSINKPRNVAELTKERLRRSAISIKSENPMFHGDLGFRVFKLDTTSVRPWNPTQAVTAESLPGLIDNILPGRTESDLLYELLLKRGLGLTVPIEAKMIADKQAYAVGAGTLISCLAPSIAASDVEALAEGIIAWHKELAPDPAPNPETPKAKPPKFDTPLVVFRDSAFVDDVAKSNLTEILKQYGLTDVRSL